MKIKIKFPDNCDDSNVHPYFISYKPIDDRDRAILDFEVFGYEGGQTKLFEVKKEDGYLVLDINEDLIV